MSDYSFFSIKTQFENIGDALINHELITLASENSEVYVDLSWCPDSFAKSLRSIKPKVTYVRGSLGLFAKMLCLRLMNKNCYYYLSPGGYFGGITIKQTISSWINTVILLLFKAFGVKLCLVGVSYERLEPSYKRLIKFRANLLDIHLLRDSHSVNYAKKEGISFTDTIPDLALNQYEYKESFQVPISIQKIGISFRSDQSSDQMDAIMNLLNKIKAILPINTEVLLYSQVQRDDKTLEYIMKSNIFEKFPTSIINSKSCTLENIAKLLSTVDVVIANRLHVLLVAGESGRNILPCILNDNNRKIEGLMSDLGVSAEQIIKMESPSINKDKLIGTSIKKQGAKLASELRKKFADIYE